MNFLETLRIGLRALHVNKMRSVLTMLGIIVGVAAVVCMVSVGSGAREEVSEKIRTLGANLLLIKPGAKVSKGARLEAGTGHTLTLEDAGAIKREIRDVLAVAQYCRNPCKSLPATGIGQPSSLELTGIISWPVNGASKAAEHLRLTN